jgi:hypothetical protein
VDDARFTSRADIDAKQTDVCFVPKADIVPQKKDRLAAVSPKSDQVF